jgi:hypothetical protein
MGKHLNGYAGGNGKSRRKGDSDQLMELVLKHLDWNLWHWEGEAYVSFDVKGHRETHKLNSSPVKRRLRHQLRDHTGRVPSSAAVNDTIAMLEAEAFATGWKRPIYLRVAEHDGVIYVDSGDERRSVTLIDMHGFKAKEAADVPVRFVRTDGMQALPEPEPVGSLDLLSRYINIAPKDLVLVYTWILAAFWPRGPYPILMLIAEQGAGKSTVMRVLRRLIDPHKAMIRTLPRDERDLMISAQNSWLLAYDNVSGVPPWLSDALSRIATGAAFTTRRLYTDAEEVSLDVQRPIMLNGIPDLASRPDLADRALVLRLPGIREDQRKPEAQFWAEFERDAPYILGAVFDVLSGVLDRIDHVQLDRTPRMADFARLGVAAEPDLPVPPGAFWDAYLGNRAGLTQAAIEDDPFIAEVAALARHHGPWEGTATELRNLILYLWGQDEPADGVAPPSPSGVSSRLRRFLPALRAEGIEVGLDHREPGTGKRVIRIRAVGKP